MPAPKPAKPAANPFGPICDELGALEKEMAPFAQKLSRIEALKKALRAGCPTAPEDPWTVEGAHFAVMLGACAMKRKVDETALVKAITAVAYAKFAHVTLSDLELFVKPAIIAAVVSSEPSGPRSLKTFEKGA